MLKKLKYVMKVSFSKSKTKKMSFCDREKSTNNPTYRVDPRQMFRL